MRTIRASSLPLALACPASQVPPQTRLADDSPESRLGSAVHEVLAAVVRNGIDGAAFSDANIAAAARWRVELTDVYDLAWNGRRAWDRLKEHFPNPVVEEEVYFGFGRGELAITGHPDFYSFADRELRVGDFKTGRADELHEDQIRAYAWAILGWVPAIEQASGMVIRLREMTVDTYRWSRQELDAWFEGVVRDTADVERFRAGRWCGFCPRRMECSHFVRAFAVSERKILNGMPADAIKMPDVMLPMHDRIKQVEDACGQAREMLRAEVAAAGGSVTASDGRTLALVRQERQEINSGLAWPVLENRFGLHAVAEAAKLTKTAVTKLAMDAAPPRGKGKAAKALLEELDAHGALITTTVEKLECRRGNANSIEAGGTAVSRPAITGGTAEGPAE